MASTLVPPSTHRVTWPAAMLLGMAGKVDSYHQAVAVAGSFNEVQLHLTRDEADAMQLIMRGLRRLFPFDAERDYPKDITPRHAL